jgi:hypothetical protein
LAAGFHRTFVLAALAKDATTIVIGEREQRTIALTMSR